MPWPAVPLGLCTVASAAADAGYEVELLDLTFSSDMARDVLLAARRFQPTHGAQHRQLQLRVASFLPSGDSRSGHGLRQFGLAEHETRMSRVSKLDDLRHYRG
jgi:hypothetical protein